MNSVRKTDLTCDRSVQPLSKVGPWTDELDKVLAAKPRKAKRDRLTLIRVFEELRARGYNGGYDAVRYYVAAWNRGEREASAAAYAPLTFDPVKVFQFDRSPEIALIDEVTTTVKVAHVRLCHSPMRFVRDCPCEQLDPLVTLLRNALPGNGRQDDDRAS